jgi:hypothetical protein
MKAQHNAISYRYTFKRYVSMDDVQDSLTLATLSTEQLHGRARIRLDASFRLDRQRRTCTIDAETAVGRDLAKLFAGYLSAEFGDQAFRVRRTEADRDTSGEQKRRIK